MLVHQLTDVRRREPKKETHPSIAIKSTLIVVCWVPVLCVVLSSSELKMAPECCILPAGGPQAF